MIQLGKVCGGSVGGVGGKADTNYLYPARWGWINKKRKGIQISNRDEL